MSIKEENILIRKAYNWTLDACIALQRSGGAPSVIAQLPFDLVITMVRNDLKIVYEPPPRPNPREQAYQPDEDEIPF